MPVIAPILSVAVAGWSTSVAIAGGSLFSFATLTAVSSVIGAVGVITKNKTLMTIGLIGSAVGGIGQWATSTGVFDAAVATGATAPPVPPAGSSSAADIIAKGVRNAPPLTGPKVASLGAEAIEEITVYGKAKIAPEILGQSSIPIVGQIAATNTALDGTTLEKTSAEKLADKRLEALQRIEDDASGANGFFGSFKTFAKDNGALLVLGGSTLSSLFEQPEPGSFERNQAETELLAAQAEEKRIQTANMQAPLGYFTPPAVAGYRGIDPVTGRQVQYATRTAADPGLINTITGAPV